MQNTNLSTRTSLKKPLPKTVPDKEKKLVQSTNGVFSAEKKLESADKENKTSIVEPKKTIKKNTTRILEHTQEYESVSIFIQSNYLKPGYKGTEYQILVLLIKLLDSINQQNNTVGLIEVANLGILDDCVLVTYPPTAKGTDVDAHKVEASQVKYFKNPIAKAQLEKGAEIGIDKLFMGYLALKNQYPNANLITSLYTNTTVNLSTQEAEDKSYLIIKESWIESCLSVNVEQATKIPYEVLQNDEIIKAEEGSLVKKYLIELLLELTLWEGIIENGQLRLEGDILNLVNYNGEPTSVPFNLEKGCSQGLPKASLERINLIYKSKDNGLPKIINFQRKLCRNIDTITESEWNKVKEYFNTKIKKKVTKLTAEDFIERVKFILSSIRRTNENIESALTKFSAETIENQKKQAQEFLDTFRIYVNQPTYEEHYSNGIKLLTQLRSSLENSVVDTDSTFEKNTIIFAYVLNKVRLWFTTNYQNNRVPALNKRMITAWLHDINSDEIFWRQFGASRELAAHVYDKINGVLLSRNSLYNQLYEAIAIKKQKVVLLQGQAGIGKSVVSKKFFTKWPGAKFFLDLYEENVTERRDELQANLNRFVPSLIIVDRAERINDIESWQVFFECCLTHNHQLLLVSRTELNGILLPINHKIIVPELTEKQIRKLHLPDFITSNAKLIALCKIPFFCRLAFDIDPAQLPKMQNNFRQHFVETAILGSHTTPEQKKQRRLIWLALCSSMLRESHSHLAIKPKAQLQKMPEFNDLCKADIVVQETTDTFMFMHDIFFEVGLVRLLNRAAKEITINYKYKPLGKFIGYCFKQLSSYDFSLLLPWINQHKDDIKGLCINFPKKSILEEINLEDNIKLISLMIDSFDKDFIINALSFGDSNILPRYQLFQGELWSLLELSVYFKNYKAFEFLSNSDNQNSLRVLDNCVRIIADYRILKDGTEKNFIVSILNWVHVQSCRKISQIDIDDQTIEEKVLYAVGDKLSFYRKLENILSKVITLDIAIELVEQNSDLSWIKGIAPFTDDDLKNRPKVVLKYCYQRLVDSWQDVIENSDTESDAFDFIKNLLIVVDLNNGLLKPYDLVDISREKIAEFLINEDYVDSISKALEVIDSTGLEADDFQQNVPFDPQYDLNQYSNDIKELSVSYIEDNFDDLLETDSNLLEVLIEVVENDSRIIEGLVCQFEIDGAAAAINADLDFDEVMEEVKPSLSDYEDIKSLNDGLNDEDELIKFYKGLFEFDPCKETHRNMLLKNKDFVFKFSYEYISDNLESIQAKLKDYPKCWDVIYEEFWSDIFISSDEPKSLSTSVNNSLDSDEPSLGNGSDSGELSPVIDSDDTSIDIDSEDIESYNEYLREHSQL